MTDEVKHNKRDIGTIAASVGVAEDAAHHGIAPPLWTADTSEWASPTDKPDYDYSRTVNPNRTLLVRALAALEGAQGGVVTNSGQSAALLALLLLKQGARVVAPHDCYGGTYRLLQGMEERGVLRAVFVDQGDSAALAAALADGADMLWLESPSNPLLRIVDIAACAKAGKQAGALVLADNTLPTPCRQKPLALGCDIVLHSTTKAINGHNDLFGGALLAGDPSIVERIEWWANAAGLSGSAHDAWQILRGLRTLPLRVDRQEKTARAVAAWLADHEQVLEVHYPGLSSHPDYELAARQQSGPGFMLSFRIKGGEAGTRKFVQALELVTLASSLGGFATLICTPASMTHRGMPPEAQAEAGILPDLLRVSIGLEGAEDLIADFERGFAAT
ncbi:trans-sulfuration enzyme family protein [Sphingosinicella rhizophila]|uniref:PLP-dependent transferase n=1 Tax=Sphingosinicella rhizophila TaxID=3050082 RepID=A0ABU3Q1R4_9SPHN|nr:PLP-dependent transferase [Sphingosinicella sp. GR2756]MDT9597356.1 PLP-dependent transferase [Sphingosinicella sp. GR2756]